MIREEATVQALQGHIEALNKTIEKQEETIEILKQEPRWIPCSERLPRIKNKTERYLVTLKNGTVCDALFTECDGEHWWNYNYDDVIAWQELPKAYKANMENNK
jgi:hypothetical protein